MVSKNHINHKCVTTYHHCNSQYFNQFDHNASEKLEIDECVKNEWTRGMSGLKINILKLKFLYFTMLLFK